MVPKGKLYRRTVNSSLTATNTYVNMLGLPVINFVILSFIYIL